MGIYKGNTISVSTNAPVTAIPHEVGHSLGLKDSFPKGIGIMNYPPEGFLSAENVDNIWISALERYSE